MNYCIWKPIFTPCILGAIVVSVAGLAPTAQAQSGSLVGQRRCAKQSTAIFSQRSATSALVRSIAENQAVTLSENGAQEGFIGVSAPAPGFVQTVNLRLCQGDNPNPTPSPSSTCRRVSQTAGLLVRQGPNVTSPVVGTVAFNSQVFLTTTPATASTDSSGRVWVRLARPVSGWVSNSFQGVPGSNLVFCQ